MCGTFIFKRYEHYKIEALIYDCKRKNTVIQIFAFLLQYINIKFAYLKPAYCILHTAYCI